MVRFRFWKGRYVICSEVLRAIRDSRGLLEGGEVFSRRYRSYGSISL